MLFARRRTRTWTTKPIILRHKRGPRSVTASLVAAHETFSLLATQPEIGWHSKFKIPALRSLRVFRVAGFERMLILYRPRADGVEILRVIHGSRDPPAPLRRA